MLCHARKLTKVKRTMPLARMKRAAKSSVISDRLDAAGNAPFMIVERLREYA